MREEMPSGWIGVAGRTGPVTMLVIKIGIAYVGGEMIIIGHDEKSIGLYIRLVRQEFGRSVDM